MDLQLKALVHLEVAGLVNSAYCLDVASAVAHYTGLDTHKITDLSNYAIGDTYTETERLVLEFVEAVTVDSISDVGPLREKLRQSMTSREFVELAATIAWDNHRSCLNRALGVRSIGAADGMVRASAESQVAEARSVRFSRGQFSNPIRYRSVRNLDPRHHQLLTAFVESAVLDFSVDIAPIREMLLEHLTESQFADFAAVLAWERRRQCLSRALGSA